MNYTFPIIETIDDVLPHIKNYEEIVVSENVQGNYVTIRYMISTPNLWEWNDNDALGCAIRRECRGIAFSTKTGKILSRPYHKFFNVNEKPETQLNLIDLEEPHLILEKLDGSMIRPIKCPDGDFYIATKAGVSEVSAQASNWLKDHRNYYDFMNYIIDNHKCTPIFEWVSRQNRIVIDYPEDNLILTGIRVNKTGKYYNYNNLKYYGSVYGIDVVDVVHMAESNIGPLVDIIKKWTDSEGIVGRFDNGHMFKCKADDYILRHYAKESINHEKNLIGLILADGLDDLLPVLHENDQKRVSDFEKDFHTNVHETASQIHDMYGTYVRNYALSDKKDFAVNFALKKEKKYQQFLFGLHRGDYNLLDALYKAIENSISSSSRVENVRWIFGGIRF